MSSQLKRIRALGCQDEKKIIMAYQTLLELTEVEHHENLVCNYNSNLDIIYLTDQQPNNTNIFIPVHSSFVFEPSWIKTAQDILSPSNPKSIILVIREGDSTFVKYKLIASLILPKLGFEEGDIETNETYIDELEIKKRKVDHLQPGCSTAIYE